jgi:AhpD family alkylhydroperoxidase
MNKLIYVALILMIPATIFAGGHSKGNPILTPLEPKAVEGKYTELLLSMPKFQKNSGFDAKTFQLISLAAAAGMKCEYCVAAHTAQAKKAGATEEELKSAVMMAGMIAINSTILYGNQYDLEALKEMLSK